MCKFLKFQLLFMLCFLVILMGCTNTKTSREFSHTMEDGSRVNIKIEYKPKSHSGDEKFGSYYYIVQYLVPKSTTGTGKQQGLNWTEWKGELETPDQQSSPTAPGYPVPPELPSIEQRYKEKLRKIGIDTEALEQQGLSIRYIEIAFYDKKGYSLLSRGTFSPGWSHNEDELNKIDGGWEWKGRFDESYITVENFRDIHSIKVVYASPW